MSGTRSSDLRIWWSTPGVDADRAYREARNVYTLNNTESVEQMIAKILIYASSDSCLFMQESRHGLVPTTVLKEENNHGNN